MLNRILLTSFLLLLFTATSVSQLIENPNGEFRSIEPNDFLAKNLPSKYYNELYTYQVQLDNGVQVLYTFSINDFGSFKSRVTGGKMAVRWLDGKDYIANKEYSVDKFINKADSNIIILHPERRYWAKGSFDDEHTINFKTTKDGVAYDVRLTLYDIAKGKIWGDGVYKIRGNQFGLSILIPHAKVKGHVSINGEKIEAEGTAVMDHIYQKNLPTKLIHKSFRVKSGDDQNGYMFNFITVKDKDELIPIGYGIRYQDGIPKKITPESIEFNESKKTHGVYLNTNIVIQPKETDEIRFEVTDHFNSYSILDELGGIKKIIAKRFLRGEVIEMNGLALVNGEKAFFSFMAIK